MKAMILAAGLGTRLRPLTNDRPKALVEISGRTLLEIALSRLRCFGVREVILNVHHFADKIIAYLKTNNNFEMRIEVSREEVLLDTGGGLKKAAWFFLEDSSRLDEPFLLHNVDVISTIDLGRMLHFHAENHALATLAVQDRQTSRRLVFDEQLHLCGRQSGHAPSAPETKDAPSAEDVPDAKDVKTELVRPAQRMQPLAFSGIHVISPRLLPMMTEEGAFSIITSYLRLAAAGENILAFRADEFYWRDVGTPDHVAQTAQDLKQKPLL